ncbi:MAG: Uma2 family endonuclease [Chloroflexi bacterium]|nr:Uma2 family endonuclease [Chloroflexota bacterium]
MIAHPLPPTLSVEEYLELEANSIVKHEYLDGHVYALAGGSVDHGTIAVNAVAVLRPQVRGGPCRVYNSDVKVRLGPGRFVYPDVSISCDPRDHADGRALFISHPRLIVEVLTPRTVDYDQGDKFAMYRALDSLDTYVLIDGERMAVEVWTRQPDGTWHATRYAPGDEAPLPTIGGRCPVTAFYEDTALTS